MKRKLLSLVVLGCAVSTGLWAEDSTLKSEKDRVSYSIGVDLGKNFKAQEIDINAALLEQGMQDVLTGKKLQLTDEQMRAVITEFQKNLMAKRAEKMKALAQENLSKGEAFLEANKKNPGVIVLADGLQYKVIDPGKGVQPKKDDTVVVEYEGKLIDGTVFDTTKRLNQPATFKVSQVVPGWVEALQMMKEGATWEIFVPSKLAYGEHNVGNMIGPNSTLIFKIHLVSVKKA